MQSYKWWLGDLLHATRNFNKKFKAKLPKTAWPEINVDHKRNKHLWNFYQIFEYKRLHVPAEGILFCYCCQREEAVQCGQMLYSFLIMGVYLLKWPVHKKTQNTFCITFLTYFHESPYNILFWTLHPPPTHTHTHMHTHFIFLLVFLLILFNYINISSLGLFQIAFPFEPLTICI